MFPLWGDSGFADAEDVYQEGLDGEAPPRYESRRGTAGSVGLEGAKAGSVGAF